MWFVVSSGKWLQTRSSRPGNTCPWRGPYPKNNVRTATHTHAGTHTPQTICLAFLPSNCRLRIVSPVTRHSVHLHVSYLDKWCTVWVGFGMKKRSTSDGGTFKSLCLTKPALEPCLYQHRVKTDTGWLGFAFQNAGLVQHFGNHTWLLLPFFTPADTPKIKELFRADRCQNFSVSTVRLQGLIALTYLKVNDASALPPSAQNWSRQVCHPVFVT